MRKHTLIKKQTLSSQRSRHRPLWLLALGVLLFVLCGVFFTYTIRSRVSTNVSQQTHTAISATEESQPTSDITPVASKESGNKQMGPQQPTVTPGVTVVATPTLVSTPQQTQFGVFPLSSGGPLPVPEGVLHPTNIARVMLNSTLVSVYAGSMTKNPQAGILCVLREDLTTGEVHVRMYQGPQTGGALTIVAVQKNVLKVTNLKMQGTFDLNTNTFQW